MNHEKSINWDSMKEVQGEIRNWADKNFPKRTAHHAVVKLMLEEIPEMLRAPNDPGEYADIVILVLDIASLRGIDIAKAVRDKMQINYRRQWLFDDSTGIASHVKIEHPLIDNDAVQRALARHSGENDGSDT